MDLLFATHNAGKAREMQAMLADKYRLLTLDDAGISDDIPETENTLQGNALLKARFLHRLSGKAVFADDTGLEVDHLNGAPGVHTARFAGPECNPANNIAKMLSVMSGVQNRTARFRTVIAYISADGQEHLFEGVCPGAIATEMCGSDGFGYDPIFLPDGQNGLSFAQMPLEAKNKISHRGRATALFVQFLSSLV